MRTVKTAKMKLYSRNTGEGFQENCQEGKANVNTEGMPEKIHLKPLISSK